MHKKLKLLGPKSVTGLYSLSVVKKISMISIVAPVYNESAGILDVIDSWIRTLEMGKNNGHWAKYEVVLCDDGSTDKTRSIIESIAEELSSIILLKNVKNQGAGASLAKAIAASKGDYLVLMDSDGQFNPEQIVKMFSHLSEHDAVCGVRSKSSSLLHNLASNLSTRYANLLFGTQIRDFNCQLKILPGSFIRSKVLRATRMNYSGEITYAVLKSNLRIKWLEIEHLPRSNGRSSTKFFRDGISRFQFITYLGYENYLAKKKVISIYNPEKTIENA